MKNISPPKSFRIGLLKFATLIVVVCVLSLGGCATPDVKSLSGSRMLAPDQEDDIGGSFAESGDIRTVAVRMCGELLSTPEISTSPSLLRIAIAPIKNSTRYMIDKDIFMKRLRIEMNRHAGGKVRFFSQGVGQNVRGDILREQAEAQWLRMTEEAALSVASSTCLNRGGDPAKIAVMPVKNTNLVGVNADSFASLIRSKIYEKAAGKVVFLARGASGKAIDQVLAEHDLKSLGLVTSREQRRITGADYFMGGEFIAMSLTARGAALSLDSRSGLSKEDPRDLVEDTTVTIKKPNVDKYFNLMLIDADSGEVAFEKLIPVEKKIKSGLGNADYLLTGELSALSKAAEGGLHSDYVIMSFQLVDPQTNELVWEDAYETKRATSRSVLYR